MKLLLGTVAVLEQNICGGLLVGMLYKTRVQNSETLMQFIQEHKEMQNFCNRRLLLHANRYNESRVLCVCKCLCVLC